MKRKDIPVILLAGGRGTRLAPLTNSVPKPMVKVGSIPLLEYNLKMFIYFGFVNFVFALCYLPEKITDYFQDGKKWGVNIGYTFENPNRPLGTAGATKLSEQHIKKTFIVSYTDILRDLDISEMLQHHQKNRSVATVNIYKNYKRDPKSLIKINRQRQVISFQERPGNSRKKNNFVWSNGSFYIFEPQVLKLIPKNSYQDFGYDILPKLLVHNFRVFAYPTDSYFLDIGSIEKLKTANKDLKVGKLRSYDYNSSTI